MKNIFLVIASACLLNTVAFSQTKKIAFESHSGRAENFSISLSNELFDSEESDFGGPGIKIESTIDSVIFFSDSNLIVVTKVKDFGTSFHNFPSKPIKEFSYKDTIRNDYAFRGRHTIGSVGAALGASYRRRGEVTDSTTFIGFKEKAIEEKKKCDPTELSSPFFINDGPPDNNSPFDPQLITMLGSILLLSLAGGWLTWRFYKPRLQPA